MDDEGVVCMPIEDVRGMQAGHGNFMCRLIMRGDRPGAVRELARPGEGVSGMLVPKANIHLYGLSIT